MEGSGDDIYQVWNDRLRLYRISFLPTNLKQAHIDQAICTFSILRYTITLCPQILFDTYDMDLKIEIIVLNRDSHLENKPRLINLITTVAPEGGNVAGEKK